VTPRQSNPFQTTPITDFAEPWSLAFLPDERILVTEKNGNLRLVDPSTKSKQRISRRFFMGLLFSSLQILPHILLRVLTLTNPRSESTWSLIKTAAEASKDVYGELKDRPDEFHLAANGNIKATTISVIRSQNRRVLVVAVRGSVTNRDWMVNANGAPEVSPRVSWLRYKSKQGLISQFKLLDGSVAWHRGFLVVAEAMQRRVAEGITEVLRADGSDDVDEIVFTGHSAGGALAQLFYASAMTPESALSAVTQSR